MALRAPEKLSPLPRALNDARNACGWSQEAFWVAYKQAGGLVGFEAFKDYLRGKTTPNVYEYDVMAQTANQEAGKELLPRVPFEDPTPRMRWTGSSSYTSYFRSIRGLARVA